MILFRVSALDWVPRSVRARAREIQRSLAELEHGLQRSPSDEELADHMNVQVVALQGHLSEISTLGFVALDELLDPGERATRIEHDASLPTVVSWSWGS